MINKSKKNLLVALTILLFFLIFISFISINIFQKKKNLALSNFFLDVQLVTNVHPSLPWKFSSKEPSIKIRPGEVKTIEYIVENFSDNLTSGIATFQYYPKELGKYFTKLNCFCFDKQTLEPGENRKYSLVILIDPEVTKHSKTKDIEKVIMQFTFFAYDKYKKDQS